MSAFKTLALPQNPGTSQRLQLNHPGRQMMKNPGQETWAPPAVPLDLGKHSKMFAAPKPMTEQEIVRLRGVEGYGLPKWKTPIDLDIGDTIRAAGAADVTDIAITAPALGTDHAIR